MLVFIIVFIISDVHRITESPANEGRISEVEVYLLFTVYEWLKLVFVIKSITTLTLNFWLSVIDKGNETIEK